MFIIFKYHYIQYTLYIQQKKLQLLSHITTYFVWIFIIASFRKNDELITYITINVVKTIKMEFETELSIQNTTLFFITLLLYFVHSIHVIWTITYKIKYIPTVTKFQTLQTPKIILNKKKII